MQYNNKQDVREAMRVFFSVLTKLICMHKTIKDRKLIHNVYWGGGGGGGGGGGLIQLNC